MTRAPESDPELERIRTEYERRRREIPEDFYALHKRANLFLRHGQERALRDGLDRAGWLPLGERRVLEVGCGEGAWLGIFERLGAVPEALAGIELDPERAAVCRQKHPAATIEVGDAGQLPWPDASFDLVFQSTLFTSILDAGTRQRVAAEMLRVLRPGGLLVWYDFAFDNPRNPNVRGVGAGELRRLFPGCSWTLRRVTLAPPLARRLVPRSWTLATLLEGLRLFNTHTLATAWRPR
ncbi:MAG: class I SAM-dependent methyltransferase [Acidobacteria bacterium]|nr:class I SAM-dependent methyltransferase [Acidobacteriota bacterium]